VSRSSWPRRDSRLLLGIAVAAALLAAPRRSSAQGAAYTFTRILVPGSVSTEATGIDGSGQVVGTYRNADGTFHGYVFDGTTYRTVDFPGAGHTYLFGLDGSGRTVGSYGTTLSGPYHGLIVEADTFSSFDFPAHETDGRAINSGGQIVGIYDAGPGTPDHGYLKTGDAYTSIDVPGANDTQAFGINDAGTITGTYRDAAGLHGFFYSAGRFGAINFPEASQTLVAGINNAGAVVGSSQRGAGANVHGFVLSGNGYRSISVDVPGVVITLPVAINDAGLVVGHYYGGDCPDGCGFLATPRLGGPCDQALALGYAAGTLNMHFDLRSSAPYTWTVSLMALSTSFPLWSVPIPAVSPAISLDVPIGGVPRVGVVVALGILRTAAGETVCADYAAVDTGTSAPAP
jgi:hypothetical protein